MRLCIAPALWQALCRTAAMYPTCTLHLHQHQGCIKGFTVEHGPEPGLVVPAMEMPGTGSDVLTYGLDVQQSA